VGTRDQVINGIKQAAGKIRPEAGEEVQTGVKKQHQEAGEIQLKEIQVSLPRPGLQAVTRTDNFQINYFRSAKSLRSPGKDFLF
jgi:hypothetical protein